MRAGTPDICMGKVCSMETQKTCEHSERESSAKKRSPQRGSEVGHIIEREQSRSPATCPRAERKCDERARAVEHTFEESSLQLAVAELALVRHVIGLVGRPAKPVVLILFITRARHDAAKTRVIGSPLSPSLPAPVTRAAMHVLVQEEATSDEHALTRQTALTRCGEEKMLCASA